MPKKIKSEQNIYFTRYGEKYECPVGFVQVNPSIKGYYKRIKPKVG